MKYRLAINGFGRIGRCVLRALKESPFRDEMQVVAINELSDLKTLAHLAKYDTTHGRFPGEIQLSEGGIKLDGEYIAVTHQRQVKQLPWLERKIDLVLECSGSFSDRVTATEHLAAGARRLLYSHPAEADEVDATVVFGINEQQLSVQDRIISNASCTTNGVVPVIKTLNDHFGIEYGTITTVHSAMNDQPVIDAYHHTDLRKTRAAGQSIIPVETELAKGIERILPELGECFTARALRVPTLNVSLMDLTVQVKTDTDVSAINAVLKAASTVELKRIMAYTEEPLASCDFNHDPRSAIVDAGQTRVSGKRMVSVLIWFDNEWAYASRMLDVACHLMCLDQQQ
jgi:erythrose-4-phosphate dehydrogenase